MGHIKRHLATFNALIKTEHTLFALPFGLLSVFLVSNGNPDVLELLFIVIALVGLRTFGMLVNRLVDRHIDSKNPRTSSRIVVLKRVKLSTIYLWAVLTLLVYIFAILWFDRLVWWLSPIPVVVVTTYPYLKRFTWLCHLGIGLVYFIMPSAVEIALQGELSLGILLLSLAALCFVVGLDILYAIADIDFDRRERVYSYPSRFGVKVSLNTARVLHLFSVLILVVVGVLISLSWLYFLGVGFYFFVTTYQNLFLKHYDLKNLKASFFTTSAASTLVLSLFGVIDRILLATS